MSEQAAMCSKSSVTKRIKHKALKSSYKHLYSFKNMFSHFIISLKNSCNIFSSHVLPLQLLQEAILLYPV